MQIKSLIVPTILTLAILIGLQAVSPFIVAIDASLLPSWVQPVMGAIQIFFAATPWAIGIGYAWALFGWLRHNVGSPEIEFEAQKLYETFIWYESLIIVISAGLPLSSATAVSAVLMAIKATLNATRGE